MSTLQSTNMFAIQTEEQMFEQTKSELLAELLRTAENKRKRESETPNEKKRKRFAKGAIRGRHGYDKVLLSPEIEFKDGIPHTGVRISLFNKGASVGAGILKDTTIREVVEKLPSVVKEIQDRFVLNFCRDKKIGGAIPSIFCDQEGCTKPYTEVYQLKQDFDAQGFIRIHPLKWTPGLGCGVKDVDERCRYANDSGVERTCANCATRDAVLQRRYILVCKEHAKFSDGGANFNEHKSNLDLIETDFPAPSKPVEFVPLDPDAEQIAFAERKARQIVANKKLAFKAQTQASLAQIKSQLREIKEDLEQILEIEQEVEQVARLADSSVVV